MLTDISILFPPNEPGALESYLITSIPLLERYMLSLQLQLCDFFGVSGMGTVQALLPLVGSKRAVAAAGCGCFSAAAGGTGGTAGTADADSTGGTAGAGKRDTAPSTSMPGLSNGFSLTV